MKSSGDSLRSSFRWTPWLALILLAGLSAGAVYVTASNGWTLWYGDAEAHLNIARRIFDAREPGYEQIGTVWLPLPHVLMAPWVRDDAMWHSGMGGVIPVAVCYVLGGLLAFLGMRRVFDSEAAGWAALAAWALNPNLLYLQSAPMTEPVALCAFAGVVWALAHLKDGGSRWAAAAGAFMLMGTLTRYEFWFLIPMVSAAVLWVSNNRLRDALIVGAIASAGPAYWLAHNWILFSNPLEFYNGYWSAKAIYQRAREGGMAPYPGEHDWAVSLQYVSAAARLCLGWPLAVLALLGAAAAVWKRAWLMLVICVALPAFYVMSLYSSGTPIFVPHLWPNTHYNTRYGMAAVPLAALALAALAAAVPARWRGWAAGVLAAIVVSPWLIEPGPENWICWKESKVNSEGRRAWTKEAAEYLAPRYKAGEGIFTSFGDLSGILRTARIPLREGFHEVERPPWLAAALRPETLLKEDWAIAYSGDKVSKAMQRLRRGPRRFECVRMYAVKGSPVVEIWRHIQ